MAAVNVRSEVRTQGRSYKATWEGFAANGDEGSPVSIVEYPDKTVQVMGTFGSGGEVTVEGSMNGVDYVTLHDVAGNELVYAAGAIDVIAENPEFIRVVASAGSGANIDVIITASR